MKYLLLARTIGTRLTSASPRPAVKWAAWALVALMPGSLLVIPLVWIARQLRTEAS